MWRIVLSIRSPSLVEMASVPGEQAPPRFAPFTAIRGGLV
jgi:hypothetical protein